MIERENLTFKDKVQRVIITFGVFIFLSGFLLAGVWFFSPPGALFSGEVMFLVFVGMVSVGIGMFLGPTLLSRNKDPDSF